MRTDPPTGDELTRLLTIMKTNVLRRADETMNQPAPVRRPRTRVIGITIAIISLLIVGSAGAALATGIIPSPFTAPQHPVTTSTPSPVATPSATPTETPAPTVAPTPVSTLVPSDPSTWTIEADEVGGVPVGGSLSSLAEAAGLEPITDTIDCSPGYTSRSGPGPFDPTGISITLAELSSRGTAIPDPTFTFAYIWTPRTSESVLPDSPTTDKGIRLGSSEADLFAAYPNIQKTVSKYESNVGYSTFAEGPNDQGRYLVFQVAATESGARTVVLIQSSTLPVAIDMCD